MSKTEDNIKNLAALLASSQEDILKNKIIRLELTGQAPRHFSTKNPELCLDLSYTGSFDLTIKTSEEIFEDLLNSNGHPQYYFNRGEVRVEGERDLAYLLFKMFK